MAVLPPPFKDNDCSGCSLATLGGRTYSRPEGTGANGVLLLGEALGAHEAQDGLPFRPHAQAGAVLEKCLRRKGLDRQQFVLWNVVACKPPANELVGAPYEQSAISHCSIKLDRIISRFNPKCILALGNTPTRTLTGYTGKKQGVLDIRGFILPSIKYFSTPDDPSSPAIPVIPTYHPSWIARGVAGAKSGEVGPHKMIGVLMRDIELSLKVARNGYNRPQQEYVIFPEREYVEQFIADLRLHPELPVLCDIETIESLTKDEDEVEKVDRITQIQFTTHSGHSVVLPWGEPFDRLSKEILSLPNPKVGHNWWEFDTPILRAHEAQIEGVQEDTMWMWHFWQPDLPKGLQYVTSFYVPGALPWKHLAAAEPGFYGGCDSDFNLRIYEGILRDLRANGMEDTYRRHIVRLHSILVETSDRGVPMSREKLNKFGDKLNEIKKKNFDLMQPLVPEEIRRKHPSEGYVRPVPGGMAKCVICSGKGTDKGTVCWACDGKQIVQLEEREFWAELPSTQICPHCGGMCQVAKEVKSRKENAPLKYRSIKCPTCKGKGSIAGQKEGTKVIRQCQILPFNPSSGEQLKEYLRHKGIEIPKDFDTGKDSTGKEELKRLAKQTKDPLLPLKLEYSEVEKLKGTYVDGWMPAEDSRVHCIFKFSPASGQLAAVRPNILTTPKQSDLGKEFRDTITAEEGHSIVEADFGAFHAKTLALCARDPIYYRLASLDVHSYLTCHLLKFAEAEKMIEWPDQQFIEFVNHHRKSPQLYEMNSKTGLWSPSSSGGKSFDWIRNFKSKKTILGIGFGMGVGKLFNQNRESFLNRADAQRVRDILEAIIPAIFRFQKDICNLAYKQGYLLSLYKYLRWFWDIYHFDPKYGGMVQGEDTEACIAFLPANHAHGHFKDTILRMDDRGLLRKYGFIIPYHDALYFHVEDKYLEECVNDVREEMTRPNPILAVPEICPNGFSCSVDIKVGKTMKDMKGFDE